MRKVIQNTTIIITAFALILFFNIFYFNSQISDHYYTRNGEPLSLSKSYLTTSYNSNGASAVYSASGRQKATVNLWGIIPIKEIAVDPIETPQLIPSGNPFGVKMFTAGSIIVGFSEIDTEEGKICPGKQAGLKEGDIILSVNKKKISYNEEVQTIIEKSEGKTVSIEIQRDGKAQTIGLNPVISNQDGKFKSGVWVRDSAAGIGTITFIDPSTNVFAGLGHAITDVDTGQIMPVGSGEVCEVTINDINKGSSGNPGELVGVFTTGTAIGTIVTNNQTGIYGTLFDDFSQVTSYPMALKQEVKTGPAKILCSFESGQSKEYNIEVSSVNYSEENEVKNMIITVTDEELIRLTGGIVQGMSGTPILQDGKLIGAVTHVFVNDSTKGYGIFAENMYNYSQNVNPYE